MTGPTPDRAAAAEVDTALGLVSVDGEVLLANVVRFGRLLRRAGMEVDNSQTAAFARSLALLGVDRRGDVRSAGRAVFVRRREDIRLYDAAFDLFWRRRTGPNELSERLPRLRQAERRARPADPADPEAQPETEERLPAARPGSASPSEEIRTADFATLTTEEARDAEAMLEALRPRLAMRRARRGRIARSGHRPAARAMLRRALATGGEALHWRWLRRTDRPRPMVLVCDISGSMERYSRFMLRFAHALQRSGAPVEVFVFGTRLTRITRQLRVRSPDAALTRVAQHVVDWSGGTRIGESLHQCGAARSCCWYRMAGSEGIPRCWRARWRPSGGAVIGCCGSTRWPHALASSRVPWVFRRHCRT
jgi:uncharacterized protein with von Willebrand factor type A (vWA) domain